MRTKEFATTSVVSDIDAGNGSEHRVLGRDGKESFSKTQVYSMMYSMTNSHLVHPHGISIQDWLRQLIDGTKEVGH